MKVAWLKSFWFWFITLFLLGWVASGAMTFGLALVRAQSSTDTALYTSDLLVTNTGTTDQGNFPAGFGFSGDSLTSANILASDGLNSIVQTATGGDVAAMPPSGLLALDSAFLETSSGFTDETTDINDAGTNDVALTPATGISVNDAFYFLLQHPGRIITVNVGQAGGRADGDWVVQWEYFNGSAYAALSDVTDDTAGFTVAGANKVSFGLPTDFATATVSTATGFPVRARVTTAGTGAYTQALGTQGFWETGLWWVFVDDLDSGQQRTYTLSMGGGTDLVTSHAAFVGDDGITTSDDASLELGSGAWDITMDALVDTSAGSNKNLFHKPDVARLYVSAASELTFEASDDAAQTTTADSADGYLLHAKSTFPQAHDADEADSVVATDVAVRVGMAFNPTELDQSFGAKLDDP